MTRNDLLWRRALGMMRGKGGMNFPEDLDSLEVRIRAFRENVTIERNRCEDSQAYQKMVDRMDKQGQAVWESFTKKPPGIGGHNSSP